ncbi:unnamed protein product [Parnassius apollo]|uniref:(apollo) hypothetical protein n=1 Tax=Parnassius apollo TaxID=110799 RepID=A0A8S3X1M3_PARAO|nr:unnamed protein product [Parnassius apollo]
MECGRLTSGLRWSSYSFAPSNPSIPSVVIEDCDSEQSNDPIPVNDNYFITYPDDDSDVETKLLKNKDYLNNTTNHDRRYGNPLFMSAEEVLSDAISEDRDAEELMKSEAKKFQDYKFCEAVNDFDIELEGGEAVPIVYLSTTRAARLQRALRLAGLKKVCLFLFFLFKVLIFPFFILSEGVRF